MLDGDDDGVREELPPLDPDEEPLPADLQAVAEGTLRGQLTDDDGPPSLHALRPAGVRVRHRNGRWVPMEPWKEPWRW